MAFYYGGIWEKFEYTGQCACHLVLLVGRFYYTCGKVCNVQNNLCTDQHIILIYALDRLLLLIKVKILLNVTSLFQDDM